MKDLAGSRTIFRCGYMSGHCGHGVKCQGFMRLSTDTIFSKLLFHLLLQRNHVLSFQVSLLPFGQSITLVYYITFENNIAFLARHTQSVYYEFSLFFVPVASLLLDKNQHLEFLCKTFNLMFFAKFVLKMDLLISTKCGLDLISSHMVIHISVYLCLL